MLYRNNSGEIKVDTPEFMGNMAKLEQRLFEWRNDLPQFLKAHFDAAVALQLGDIDDVFARLGAFLYLRYNNVVILLHRPYVSAALCGEQLRTTMASTISLSSLEICMQISKDTLSTIAGVHSSINQLCAWWYTVYYSTFPLYKADCSVSILSYVIRWSLNQSCYGEPSFD